MKNWLWKIGTLDESKVSPDCLISTKEYYVAANRIENAIEIFRKQTNLKLFISFIEKEGEVFLDK